MLFGQRFHAIDMRLQIALRLGIDDWTDIDCQAVRAADAQLLQGTLEHPNGFVGNILLKFAEAVGNIVVQMLKEELPRGINGKLGTALLKPNLQRLKKRIDAAEHGGGLLLGVEGVCIISHGSSDAFSIANAIRSAKSAVDKNVIEQIKSSTRDKSPKVESPKEESSVGSD